MNMVKQMGWKTEITVCRRFLTVNSTIYFHFDKNGTILNVFKTNCAHQISQRL